MKKITYTLWAVLLFTACSTSRVTKQQLAKAKARFTLVTNQMGPNGAGTVDQSLSAINPKEQNSEGYIPVLAWKKRADAFNPKYYAPVGSLDTFSSSYLTWVTKKSEMSARAKEHRLHRLQDERLALRMEQLLGLAPEPETDTSRVFIEIWVKEKDLFRPCRDPEVSDQSCSLYFPQGAYATMSSAYDTVYQGLIENNIRKNPPAGQSGYWAPWTRMGYTYDWHPRNRTHIGMSEYIIRQGAIVKIEAKTSTAEWMNANVPSN